MTALYVVLGALYLPLGSFVFGVCGRRWGKPDTAAAPGVFSVPPLVLVWPIFAVAMLCLRIWEIGAGRKVRVQL